jgi:hypothetical protein
VKNVRGLVDDKVGDGIVFGEYSGETSQVDSSLSDAANGRRGAVQERGG